MPKYLILKHYAGGPDWHHDFVPMSEWTADEIRDHIAFQRQVADMLRERGEFVDAQALSPDGAYVRFGGPVSFGWLSNDFGVSGVIGDPLAATAERGAQLFAAAVDASRCR